MGNWAAYQLELYQGKENRTEEHREGKAKRKRVEGERGEEQKSREGGKVGQPQNDGRKGTSWALCWVKMARFGERGENTEVGAGEERINRDKERNWTWQMMGNKEEDGGTLGDESLWGNRERGGDISWGSG